MQGGKAARPYEQNNHFVNEHKKHTERMITQIENVVQGWSVYNNIPDAVLLKYNPLTKGKSIHEVFTLNKVKVYHDQIEKAEDRMEAEAEKRTADEKRIAEAAKRKKAQALKEPWLRKGDEVYHKKRGRGTVNAPCYNRGEDSTKLTVNVIWDNNIYKNWVCFSELCKGEIEKAPSPQEDIRERQRPIGSTFRIVQSKRTKKDKPTQIGEVSGRSTGCFSSNKVLVKWTSGKNGTSDENIYTLNWLKLEPLNHCADALKNTTFKDIKGPGRARS